MAIYKVSFPSPNPVPGEDPYDTLDTAELQNTRLNDDNIKQMNDDKTNHIIKYEFGRRQLMPENKEQIYIKASCSTISKEEYEEVLDIQTFVDEVAKGVYERKTPDYSPYVIEAKTKLKTIFANKLLENEKLAINTRYDGFGYIYSGIDKIGTCEGIFTETETEVKLVDMQSIVDLKNAQKVSVQLFIEKKYLFLLNITSMKEENTAIISSMTAEPNATVPEEVLELKNKKEYDSEEDFWTSRRKLVNTDLVPDSYTLDDLDI